MACPLITVVKPAGMFSHAKRTCSYYNKIYGEKILQGDYPTQHCRNNNHENYNKCPIFPAYKVRK